MTIVSTAIITKGWPSVNFVSLVWCFCCCLNKKKVESFLFFSFFPRCYLCYFYRRYFQFYLLTFPLISRIFLQFNFMCWNVFRSFGWDCVALLLLLHCACVKIVFTPQKFGSGPLAPQRARINRGVIYQQIRHRWEVLRTDGSIHHHPRSPILTGLYYPIFFFFFFI